MTKIHQINLVVRSASFALVWKQGSLPLRFIHNLSHKKTWPTANGSFAQTGRNGTEEKKEKHKQEVIRPLAITNAEFHKFLIYQGSRGGKKVPTARGKIKASPVHDVTIFTLVPI